MHDTSSLRVSSEMAHMHTVTDQMTIKYNFACRSDREGNPCSYFEIKYVCLCVICRMRVKSKVSKPLEHTHTHTHTHTHVICKANIGYSSEICCFSFAKQSCFLSLNTIITHCSIDLETRQAAPDYKISLQQSQLISLSAVLVAQQTVSLSPFTSVLSHPTVFKEMLVH